MRVFADDISGPPCQERFAGALRSRERPGGIDELEWRLRADLPGLVLYNARMTSSMCLLIACCGNAFDSTLAAVRAGADQNLADDLVEHWTSFAHMTANGQRGDLSDLGITLITDPGNGVKSGCVATVVSPRASESELKDAVARVIQGGVSAIGQGVDAAVRSPRIRGLLATQSDHAALDGRLEAMAAAGFAFHDARRLLDLDWPTG